MSGFPSTAHLTSVTGAPASQGLLLAVVALLAIVIIGLVAMAIVMRRRQRTQPPAPPELPHAAASGSGAPRMGLAVAPRVRSRPVVRGGGGGGLAVATSTAMVCPTCRTEYHGMTYCTRDARRLVPPEEMMGGSGINAVRTLNRSAGLVCMACRRAYEPGLRACPHDGNELVPFPVYNATRPRSRTKTSDPTGVIARICPVCSTKYDLNARFCGHDAGELVVIN
jgi:hypothetical protein